MLWIDVFMLGKKLTKGSTISVVGFSKKLTEEHKQYLKNFKEYAEEIGLNVVYGKNLFSAGKFGVASGTPEERAEDINTAFKDDNVDAIWLYQGGQVGNQVLDLLDYDLIKENPKLLIGMSDIDVGLIAINKFTGLISFNATDPKMGRDLDLDFEYTKQSFKERLFEGEKEIKSNSEWKTILAGEASGKIIGCNISSILKLAGTKYFPDFKDSIIFLEGYHEDLDKAIRQLEQLKQIGVFDQVKGMVIGFVYGFEAEEQFDGANKRIFFEDVALEATKNYSFPILKIQEFGHRCQTAFIPIGANVKLDATNKKLQLIEDIVG